MLTEKGNGARTLKAAGFIETAADGFASGKMSVSLCLSEGVRLVIMENVAVYREMKCCSFCLILVLEICLISYRNLCDAGDLLVNQKVSNDRLLRALKSAQKDQRLDRELCSAAEKLSEGKRLKSLEFDEVYALIFKPGPCLKYVSPEKWERVSRDSLHES